jgi:hypothetical protein
MDLYVWNLKKLALDKLLDSQNFQNMEKSIFDFQFSKKSKH